MTRESRTLWNKLQKARKLEIEKQELIEEIICVLEKYDEIDIDLDASNSSNVGETISCFVCYGEDENKLLNFFEIR